MLNILWLTVNHIPSFRNLFISALVISFHSKTSPVIRLCRRRHPNCNLTNGCGRLGQTVSSHVSSIHRYHWHQFHNFCWTLSFFSFLFLTSFWTTLLFEFAQTQVYFSQKGSTSWFSTILNDFIKVWITFPSFFAFLLNSVHLKAL